MAYCNYWWVVVWDATMIDCLEIPPPWGILAREDRTPDGPALTVVRKAARRPEADKAIDRHTLAMMLRAAVRTSAGAWRFAQAVAEADRSGRRQGRETGKVEARDEIDKLLLPLLPAWRAATAAKSWEAPKPGVLLRWAIAQAREHPAPPTPAYDAVPRAAGTS